LLITRYTLPFPFQHLEERHDSGQWVLEVVNDHVGQPTLGGAELLELFVGTLERRSLLRQALVRGQSISVDGEAHVQENDLAQRLGSPQKLLAIEPEGLAQNLVGEVEVFV
jgi:hypothetical protein